MTLPKDPAKREAYLQLLREKGKKRYEDPERRKIDSERTKAIMANPKARQAISEKAKARLADPEVRQAMSERGKARFEDPEERKASSERSKALFADPDWKRKNLEARIEAQRQPEARANISAVAKKRFEDPEYRQNLDEKRAEAMARPEVRAKISTSKKIEAARPERRAQLRQQALDEMAKPEARERSRQAAIEQNAQPGAREKHSAFMKEYLARPESEWIRQQARKTLAQNRQQPGFVEAVAKGLAASKKYSRTNIEQIVESILQATGIEYDPQKHIGRWIVDFFIPSKSLCIECDGDYWHSTPRAQDRDARKDADLQQRGYTVLRILGSQIMSGDLDVLIEVLAV